MVTLLSECQNKPLISLFDVLYLLKHWEFRDGEKRLFSLFLIGFSDGMVNFMFYSYLKKKILFRWFGKIFVVLIVFYVKK